MGKKLIDISGTQVGYWKVGEVVRKGGKVYYNCTCICGKQKVVNGYSLRSGQSTSCGCRAKLGKGKDITGQRFYSLTAVEPQVVGNRTKWLCRCDCGNTILVKANNLRSGYVKNCGCKLGNADRRRKALEDYCKDGTYIPGLRRSKMNSNNSSGVTGVDYRKDRNKWRAYIKVKRKNIFLGYFDTKEQAVTARKAGEKYYFGRYLDQGLTESRLEGATNK